MSKTQEELKNKLKELSEEELKLIAGGEPTRDEYYEIMISTIQSYIYLTSTALS